MLGAAIFFKRDVLLRYLEEEVAVGVKYLEDFCMFLMIFDGIKFAFLDKNIVYYEYGFGISTSGNALWIKRLKKEEQIFWGLLLKRCAERPEDFFAEKVKSIIEQEQKGTLPLPFTDRKTSVRILFKSNISKFARKYEILKRVEEKYRDPLTVWGKICRRLELLKVPEVFFYLLRARFFLETTDTDVPTAFAELCLSWE